MESQVQIKLELDNTEYLPVQELQILDDCEGVMKSDSTHVCDIFKMVQLPENGINQSFMDDYGNGNTQDEDNVEESKDFLIDEDFPLKDENVICHQDETHRDNDQPLVDKVLNSGNIVDNHRSGLLEIVKDEVSDLSHYGNEVRNVLNLESAEIVLKKAKHFGVDSDSVILEHSEVDRTKSSLQDEISEGLKNIKQEVIHEEDLSPPQVDMSGHEQDDINERVFRGFEKIGLDVLNILRIYSDILNTEQGEIDSLGLVEDFEPTGQAEYAEKSSLKFTKIIVGNLEHCRRNTRVSYLQQNFMKCIENVEHDEVIETKESLMLSKNEDEKECMVETYSAQNFSLDQPNLNGDDRAVKQCCNKEGIDNMEQDYENTSQRQTVERDIETAEEVDIDGSRIVSIVGRLVKKKQDYFEGKSQRRKNGQGKAKGLRKSDGKSCGGKSSKNSEVLECSLCSYKSSTKAYLEVHMRFHRGDKPYVCTVCSDRFVVSYHLKRHMLIHVGTGQAGEQNEYRPRVPCTVCEKSFASTQTLKDHMRVHTGAKPFHCTVCGKGFSQSSNLIRHQKTHTGEKQFECTVCLKTFSQEIGLKRHMDNHVGEKKFHCSVCSRRFSQASTLSRHEWIHKNDKPYKCTDCSKSFTRMSCLIKHMKQHD